MTTVLEVIQKELQGKLDTLNEALVTNRVETLADYKYMAGQYRGLRIACEYIKDVERKLNNDEEIEQ